jgi:hypothetical protein
VKQLANYYLELHETANTSSSTFVTVANSVVWQVPPLSPGLMQRQPSLGNVLARTSSCGSSAGGPSGSVMSVTRQGSQTSLFEQFACTAKELVRETTRQSSQDGLLAQMDKVSYTVCELQVCLVSFVFL